MPINQLNKITWIVNTIANAGKISFEDLNRKWRNNVDMSGGEDLSKRTFHKWRDAIFDTFGLIIECEKGGSYRYYIDNPQDLQNDSLDSWLLNTTSISNSLQAQRIFSVERTSTNSTISPERNANTDPPPPLPTKGGERTPERK